jgi:hypothetical protein
MPIGVTEKFDNTETKDAKASGVGMIIRQKEPVNFEFPFDKLDFSNSQ